MMLCVGEEAKLTVSDELAVGGFGARAERNNAFYCC